MSKQAKDKINAKGMEIGIYSTNSKDDYISLTDIARYRSDQPFILICNWMKSRDIVEFLGLWEKLHNPNFKPIEFDRFKNEAGRNVFTLSPEKWTKNTGSIGIISKRGRDGGTYAHIDIALEFASWISAEFKLYLMKDYRRLKEEESSRLSLDWNLNRAIAKLNYKIHTDAIRNNIIPPDLTEQQINNINASEADLLNVALFGKTAKEWKEESPNRKGNIRDDTTIEQLLVLANLESYNAALISQDKNQSERLSLLRDMVVKQLKSLTEISASQLKLLDNKK